LNIVGCIIIDTLNKDRTVLAGTKTLDSETDHTDA